MSEYIAKCTEVTGISGNPIMVPDYIDLNSEIVRCRDCRFSIAHGNGCGRNQDIYDAEPDGFCAWATRREVGE